MRRELLRNAWLAFTPILPATACHQRHYLETDSRYSAYIASVLTSLIATCLHAGVNALEYLVALQEHRTEVFAAPEAWLPWRYQAHLGPP